MKKNYLSKLKFTLAFSTMINGTVYAKDSCAPSASEPVCILRTSICHGHITGQGSSTGTVVGTANVLFRITSNEYGKSKTYEQIQHVSGYDSINWTAAPSTGELSLQNALALAIKDCEGELTQFKLIYPYCYK